MFDKDGSGCIDAAELKTVLHNLKQNPTDKDVDDMIKELDTNGIVKEVHFHIVIQRHSV
jgi:Ca2+-binding EF-hand superfamily protein